MGEVAEEGTHDVDGEKANGVEGEAANAEMVRYSGGPREVGVDNDSIEIVEVEEAVIFGAGEKKSSIVCGIRRGQGTDILNAMGKVEGDGGKG